MKEEFKPVFDSNDGGFWMSFQDFMTKFVSVNVCMVKPWQEARMKGKFIRLTEKSNPKITTENPDWVISKFYYTFTVSEACNIMIGLHQEDDRIEGADKRPQTDLAFCVLQKDENGSLNYVFHFDYKVSREVQFSEWYEPGEYIIVPLTSGGLLSRPEVMKNERDWSNISLP